MITQKKISGIGFYVFLIPVFFVLHGALENFGFVGLRDCFFLLLSYLLAAIVIFLMGGLLFRNPLKASLFTAFLLSFYLFFGALIDFFKAHIPFLSHYSVLMPLFLISTVLIVLYLKKTKKELYKITFFLNILLIIYLLFDTASLIWKWSQPDKDQLAIYGGDLKNNYTACADCKDPDIYFLLFDEYASTSSLKETYHFDNSAMDSFLVQHGFSLQQNSHSNYNITPFSMASMLNMNYLSGVKNEDTLSIYNTAHCIKLIRNNEVIRYLSSRNYEIINYSIFDLAGNPSLVESTLLPVKTRLITDQTLYNRLVRDIGWHLYIGKFEIKWLTKNIIYSSLHNDNLLLESVKEESRKKTARPRFVYTHISMPHYPFYYDANLELRKEQDLVDDMDPGHVDSYLKYLPYTNKNIRELIDTIQRNTNFSAVIMLMGDHGYRTEIVGKDSSHYYKNLNAIYLPAKDYHQFPDNLIGVNQFRVLFNSLYHQQLPLLRDSTIFIRVKP
jgi:hypothetical protein